MYIYKESFPKVCYETFEYIINEWRSGINRANNVCEICKSKIKTIQVVCKIPINKNNLKIYGFTKLHSRNNHVCVCSNKCKKKVERIY